jgi:hypothetical protein
MLVFRTSRWWGLFSPKYGLTPFFFPHTIIVGENGIETKKIRFFLFPWMQEREMMSVKKVSSVRHIRGFVWDKVVLETSGGSNDLEIGGLRKSKAKQLVKAFDELLGDEKSS